MFEKIEDQHQLQQRSSLVLWLLGLCPNVSRRAVGRSWAVPVSEPQTQQSGVSNPQFL